MSQYEFTCTNPDCGYGGDETLKTIRTEEESDALDGSSCWLCNEGKLIRFSSKTTLLDFSKDENDYDKKKRRQVK